MGIVFRQSIKTSVIILGGAVLGILTQYLSTLVLPVNLVGISRNLINQGVVLQNFLLLGTSSVTYLYLQRFSDQRQKQSVLLTLCLLVPIVTTALFCIFYFLFKDYIITRFQLKDQDSIREFFAWLPVFGLAWAYLNLMEYYLIGKMKTALANFMREILLRILGLALIGFFYWGLIDFHEYIISSILIYFIPLLLLFYFAARENDFRPSFRFRSLSFKEYKDVTLFSWYHLLSSVSVTLLAYVDSLMLAPLSKNGADDVAVYSIAQLLISMLFIPYRALSVSAIPKINEVYTAGDHPKLNNLYGRTNLNILIASTVMFLLVLSNVGNAVAILPEGYSALAPLLLILTIGRAVDVATGLNSELISITPYYKFNFRISLLLLVVVAALDRIYIPQYGVYGAAWVTSLSLVGFNTVKMVFVHYKTGMWPFSRQSFVVIGCGLAVYAVLYFIPAWSNPIADTLLRSACAIVLFGLSILWLKPSPDLQAYLDAIRKNKKLLP